MGEGGGKGVSGKRRGLISKSAAKMAALQFAEGGLRTGKLFWAKKMAANIARDRFVTRSLRRQGWSVLRIWEHDLAAHPAGCLHRIRRALIH
jgi:hypothetical protein